jgi:hypothetical protein
MMDALVLEEPHVINWNRSYVPIRGNAIQIKPGVTRQWPALQE